MKKKYVLPIALAIMLGLIIGNSLFKGYHVEEVMTTNGTIYILQYGAYTDINVLNENIKKLKHYIIVNENNKYYVYLGIFTNYENAKRVSKMYLEDDIYVYIKTDYLSSSLHIENFRKLDLSLNNLNSYTEIIKTVKKGLDYYKKNISI